MRALIVAVCGVLTVAQIPGRPVDSIVKEQEAIVADLKAALEDLKVFKTDPAKLKAIAARQTALHQKIAGLTEAQKKELAERTSGGLVDRLVKEQKAIVDELKAAKGDAEKVKAIIPRMADLGKKMQSLTDAQKKEFAAKLLKDVKGPGGDGVREGSSVRGTVTQKNKPLREIILSFYPSNGKARSTRTDTEGRYTWKDAPEGNAKVTLQGDGIPAAYQDFRKTPLSVTIKKGRNLFDIQIP